MSKMVRLINLFFLRLVMLLVYIVGVGIAHVLYRVGRAHETKLDTRQIEWESPY